MSNWADAYIAALGRGETVSFRPRGKSMSPRIEDKQLVTVMPLGNNNPLEGNIVLCTVHGKQYLHYVKAVQGDQYAIGNARGGINGSISISQIHGILIKVEW